MNILMIGLDSMSSNHFKRIFPLTYDYLSRDLDNNLIFEHLNSVGSNTYPNMLALLCGIVEESCPELGVPIGEIDSYRSLDSTFHDHLPFIWKAYEQRGYLSMYQEDDPAISTFNYYKKGFRYKPAAVYNRAFNVKYYDIRSGPDKCHFKKPTYETYLDQLRLFVERMNSNDINKATPYFSFSFLTEYTHNYLAIPRSFDSSLKQLLDSFESKGYLNNTMVILFGDHGNRLKFYSYATEIGKFERYRPFLSIKMPQRFKNSSYMRNMHNNRNKLLSFYDLHQTLRHSLYLDKHYDRKDQRGISLFEKIPMNRSCKHAFIPDKQCSCHEHKLLTAPQFEVQSGFELKNIIPKIVKFINQLTFNYRSDCRVFGFKKAVSIKEISSAQHLHSYAVVLILEPGEAWFETIFSIDSSRRLEIKGAPNRISAYGTQSECISDAFLKNYCVCRSWH